MQFDRTEIVIRQRSALELFDLSLLVLRRHIKPIALTCGLLGIPLLILDVLAVAWMMGEDAFLMAEHLPSPETAMRWRYTAHLIALFVMQFPLISLPTTVFLGNQIFFESMAIPKLLRRLAPIAWRCVLVLGILRLGLVGLLLELFVNRQVTFDPATEIWILIVIPIVGLFLRASWPFAPEILGLELCPLRSGAGGELTYAQRSRGLHGQLAGENISRFVGAACFSGLLALMFLGVFLFLQGVLTGNWQWNRWFDYLYLPLTLWLVGLFIAVFRFLSYLDSRIRLEGWEVELSLRAEALRLAQEGRPIVSTTLNPEEAAV